MSKTTSPQKSRKKDKDAKHFNRIFGLKVSITILLFILLGGIYMSLELIYKPSREQSAMVQYLEDKYGQAFVVEKPVCRGGGLGISCVWSADAYPKSDKSIKIHVSRVDNQTKYSDDYVVRTWQKEQTAKIQPKAREIFKDMPVDVKVRLGVIDPDVERAFTLNSPTFEEVFLAGDKDKYGLTVYSIAIRCRGDGEMPKDDIASRLFEIVQYIRLQGVSRVSSSVLDISEKDRRGVSCGVDENTSLESVKKCLDNISALPEEDLIW